MIDEYRCLLFNSGMNPMIAISKFCVYLRIALYKYAIMRGKKILPAKNIVVDIVIPVIPKDLSILPLCIAGIRENVNHVIGAIYIVAPDDLDIKRFCNINNMVFVDECSVLGYGTEGVNFVTKDGVNRSGWIFQQLLKLSGQIGTNRYYLVIDSDHILLKPHTFITDTNKLCFYQSTEWHYPYYKNIKKLIGKNAIHGLSYVAHKMIFDKKILASLHCEIEGKNNCAWDKAIINSLDNTYSSSFSEYELYGTFVPSICKTHLPWIEKPLRYTELEDYSTLQKRYKEYMSVTFPEYLNEK